MPDDHSTGDPIPEVFDPDRIDARFVGGLIPDRAGFAPGIAPETR